MKNKIAVIGLGYVGLPLAVEFGKKIETVGFDINLKRIKELNNKFDCTGEILAEDLDTAKKLILTDNSSRISDCNIYIITVPTPIDESNIPDLTPIESASRMVGGILKMGDIVIYESTVFPGCTEEVCVPILEENSGFKYNNDFYCGYSPERINPGDKEHTLTKIKKITSGSTPEIAKVVDDLYASIITAGTYSVSCIKIAEAAKVIENTQRDINIAFVNELSLIFNKMGIKTSEVLDAAATKWNFLNFRPGLVGGHCIGVDPYYLTHKSEALGYTPEIILSGRRLNDRMGKYISDRITSALKAKNIDQSESNCLILGLTFKENCSDVRNTKVLDIYKDLVDKFKDVEISDPRALKEDIFRVYGKNSITIQQSDLNKYDVVILAVNHTEYEEFYSGEWISPNQVIFDVKSVIRFDKVLSL
ncbi:MAG: nucleotide sugar dehydrogenase [Candidatus Marinimicrobia bacterium]|nr:nucleotide sugar dehydrogenase [Candidatus Neomarinimicrobiota bacterium]